MSDKNFQDELKKAVDNISANHNKIIDDWCKAYLAQRYKEGKSIDVGSFTLCQQNLSWAQNEVGFKYWFEDGKPNYNDSDGWIKCSDRLPEKGKIVLLYQTWPPETMFNMRADPLPRNFTSVGGLRYDEQFISYNNQYGDALKHVTHWMPLPEAPNN